MLSPAAIVVIVTVAYDVLVGKNARHCLVILNFESLVCLFVSLFITV